MNCQDITRVANSGDFAGLSEAERAAAEAHAHTCRHCAPVWAVHARLADMRMPPMPAELAVRVRALATSPAHASGRRGVARLTVVGSLVALAAAAGVFALYSSLTRPQEPPAAAAIMAAPAAGMPTNPEAVAAASGEEMPTVVNATPDVQPTQAVKHANAPLPLVPAPVYNQTARVQVMDLALQKLVERHPELVTEPAPGNGFVAAIALHEDGRVLTSTVRPVTDASEGPGISTEVNQTVPTDSGNQYNTTFRKATRLPDGRTLRANVSARVIPLSNNYDAGRSDLRVLQAIGDRYNHLLLPAAGGLLNRLVLFMSEDGQIQREYVERVGPATGRTLIASSPDDVAFLADSIAKPLGLDVRQIGQIGTAVVEKGSMVQMVGADGDFRPDDRRQMLMVTYAWPRRTGESGPRWGQSPAASQESPGAVPDKAAALAIVEREIPDAFRIKDPAAGTPTVVLTARGELIRAGRIQLRSGPIGDMLRDELVPGVTTNSFSTIRVTNRKGESADVMFAWEAPRQAAADQ